MTSYTDAQQHFRSNRKHLRIDTELTCQVRPPGGQPSTAQVLDLSVGGLKFRCDHATVNRLIPEGKRTVGLIMDVDINVQLTLPDTTKRGTIKSAARIIHSERLAQDVFHIGIKFLGLDLTAVQLLDTFISAQGSPP